MNEVIGVDIGGSHITVAAVNTSKGSIDPAKMVRVDVDAKGSCDVILQAWTEVINGVAEKICASKIRLGIAMPGPFDYENGISLIQEQDKFRSLYQMNIADVLGERLDIESKNIRFINDAAAFAKGEAMFGTARNKHAVLMLTFGTGLGAATVVNGIAADIALWDLPFKNGIAEDYLSTRWFVAQAQKKLGIAVNGVKEMLDADICSEALLEIFGEFGQNLSKFLALANKNYPSNMIVLGGNIAKAYPFFRTSLEYHLSIENLDIPIQVSLLEEKAALMGAASIWI